MLAPRLHVLAQREKSHRPLAPPGCSCQHRPNNMKTICALMLVVAKASWDSCFLEHLFGSSSSIDKLNELKDTKRIQQI